MKYILSLRKDEKLLMKKGSKYLQAPNTNCAMDGYAFERDTEQFYYLAVHSDTLCLFDGGHHGLLDTPDMKLLIGGCLKALPHEVYIKGILEGHEVALFLRKKKELK